ncbi:uncharacterized protein LDX57_009868 [Aspergillus melleus]|uniref:uncharacterized protein n=1 Tax=Aspergillus melleus TaxID=138277 RepID=UPI001E8E55AB|nr:uncharacterized protein LDX57_009868 [Aspergillus melleus]KAH8432230.1 hypothetical protein LDX57_009868 [Aspergillus melleus]
MTIPADQVPDGWTGDPDELEFYLFPHSVVDDIAKAHGLTEPNLVIHRKPESGEMCLILESGNNYYWGDYICDDIFLITKPKTLKGILHTLATKGDGAFKTRKVEPVELDEEETERGNVQKQCEDVAIFVPID